MKQRTLLAYFGHHKCATTWINHIIEDVCSIMNMKPITVHGAEMFKGKLSKSIIKDDLDFLVYTNANMDYVSGLDRNFRGFHVIRDPRDIVISAYFSHLNSHPTKGWHELEGYRQELKKVSKDEGLFIEMNFRKEQFEVMYNWDYSQPNVLEMKMEDIIGNHYEKMIEAFSFLNIINEKFSLKDNLSFFASLITNEIHKRTRKIFPFHSLVNTIPVNLLLGYLYQRRFSAITKGREHGEEDVKSHYRKGISGDWKNHFNAAHRDYFKKNYNDVLLKLGYEESENW